MSDDDRGPADAAYLGPLDVDVLVDEVIASFTPRIREAIRREDVVAVFRDLDLGERRLIRRATRLSVRWLRFSGAKGGGEDGTAIPFTYEQRFASGVNIIHIPDNQVGKSSIMKTIKFALTGDNGDYDTDVKRWITDISLTFALDNHPFTVIIASGDDGFQALLIDGEEQGGLKAALQGGREVIFDASDAANLKEEFKQFFFQRLGLKALSWTQASSTKDGTAAERSTSWLTYFQILLMPEGGDKYLLCDPTHAIGNQDGLIFSSFLGLNLTEPINQLGVEAKKAKKEVEHTRQQAQQAVQEAEQLIARLEDELRAKHTAADTLVREQRARRQALEDGDLARKLSAAQRALVEKSAEREELLARRETLNREIAQDRSRAKRLREAIELQLHFTGLEVRLCPNCDTAVAAEAISREQTAHVCRLCGHQAHDADPETIEALEMQAVELNEFVSRADRERMRLNARLGQLRQEIEQAEAQVGRLRQFASQDLSAALPTEDEEARRAELYQAIGRLQAEIDAANQRKAIDPTSEQTADLHRKIVERGTEEAAGEGRAAQSGVAQRARSTHP